MAAYLADTSIWAWAKRSLALAEKLRQRIARGEVATCVPVALEVLHSSRDGAEYEEDRSFLGPLDWLPLTPEAADRALEIQRTLAHTTHGAHRLPAVDYLVASIAEAAGSGIVIWHHDRDLGRLCDLVGHPHEQERVSRRR